MKWELQQKGGKYKKVSNKSYRAGEYNDWTEKNTLKGFNSRLDKVQERISQFEQGCGSYPIRAAQLKGKKRCKDSLRDLWHYQYQTD